jgi:hypothetical protein
MITLTAQAMTFPLTGLARTGAAGGRGGAVAAGPAAMPAVAPASSA